MIHEREYNLAQAGHHAEQASEMAEVLDLPSAFFSPRGGEKWHQVVSRSEIEGRKRHHEIMAAHYERQAAAP